MAYVGNTVTTQGFVPAVDFFSGNASTTAFTLSRPVASFAQVEVYVSNVPQTPGAAFTVSGNTITFTSAPPSGTNNIYVYYTSPITQVFQPSQGTITPVLLDNTSSTGTGALTIPTGTTAQRPTSPTIGMVRMNSTTNSPEWYYSTSNVWVPFSSTPTYLVDYLVVGGGGGGGGSYGAGGGGAGGYLQSSTTVTAGSAYTVTVGAGGAGRGSRQTGVAGSNSVFGAVTATGGGYGGGDGSSAPGGSGGSGGGGAQNSSAAGGSGTVGQGNNGGSAAAGAVQYGGGGGGGASAGGSNGSTGTGGAGGAGTANSLSGASVTYAGGGGGSGETSSGGAGGAGGGGAGTANNTNGGAGTANTGGGGGAGGGNAGTASGGNGGSGIVIIRYLGAQRATGGTVTTSGGYTIHTFTSSGTFTA